MTELRDRDGDTADIKIVHSDNPGQFDRVISALADLLIADLRSNPPVASEGEPSTALADESKTAGAKRRA